MQNQSSQLSLVVEHNEHRGCIQLYDGQMFNPINPTPDPITIPNIAHAASMMCRYGGHSKFFYSVGEHSALVAQILLQWGESKTTALAGLLHDADEALGLPDLPRPVKQQMPWYKAAGEVVQAAVFKKFHLPFPMEHVIHVADNSILFLAERLPLMGDINGEHWGYTGELRDVNVHIRGLQPLDAENLFLKTYEQLVN